jgi:hypothetical protein
MIWATAGDGSAGAASAHSSNVERLSTLGWIVIIVVLSVLTWRQVLIQELELVHPARTISRTLVVTTYLIGFAAILLVSARGWGVHIEACRTVGELETCQGQASARQVVGMLAWHAANVVPGLDITHSLEWPRPARSADAFVGVSILAVRLWVVIGILTVFKRLWDKWGSVGSSPTVSG